MRDERVFYVNWCLNRGMPTVKHSTQEEAVAEARRLAAQFPGFRFYTLRAVCVSGANDVVTRNLQRLGDYV